MLPGIEAVDENAMGDEEDRKPGRSRCRGDAGPGQQEGPELTAKLEKSARVGAPAQRLQRERIDERKSPP